MTVKELVTSYLKWVHKNRPENTYKSYRTNLRAFTDHFGDQEFATLSALKVQDWYGEQHYRPDGREYAPDTIRQRAITLQALQTYAINNKVIAEAILPKLEKPTGNQRNRIPTAEETNQILMHSPADFALVYKSLRQSGCRPGELCNAQISDIRSENGSQYLELKHHKTAKKIGARKIPIGSKLQQLFSEAIGDRKVGPIFLRSNGNAWSTNRLGDVFRRLRRKLDLAEDLVIYLTRHEHGTKLANEVSLVAARDALGHKSIQTTNRYLHTSDEEQRSNQDLMD